MSMYVQNVRRIARPGKFWSVIGKITEFIKASDRPGVVSFTVSTPAQAESSITSAITFDSISDVEKFHDAFRENPDSTKSFDEIASDCTRVDISLLRIIEQGSPPITGNTPKYFARNFFIAKRGEAQNLLEAVSEFNSAMKSGTMQIAIPAAGNLDLVRALAVVSSLEELEAWGDEATSDKFKANRQQISELTVRASRNLSRVEYFKLP